jgi:hypothetical protein
MGTIYATLSKNQIVVGREFFDLLLSPASKILNTWFEVSISPILNASVHIDHMKQLCGYFISIDSLHLVFFDL